MRRSNLGHIMATNYGIIPKSSTHIDVPWTEEDNQIIIRIKK